MAEDKVTIQARMLSNIPDEYDKTEGSFFYDATKPTAIELASLDLKAESILNKGFADTAEGEYLDKKCSEKGLSRKQATKSSGQVTITGTAGALVVKNEMVASDNVNFIFTEDKTVSAGGSVIVSVECELFGSQGNVPVGAVKYFPKTLEGLQSVTNTLAFTNGYDEESDESLRERYYTHVRTPATSGNKYHYLNWAKEVVGVGNARVVPLANGPGTVKLIIINSNMRAADNTLVTNTYNHIEDNRPIGATVTVVSAAEKIINISASLVIDSNNYSLLGIKAAIESNITEYLKSIAFKENYVSYAKIGNIIFDTPGVLDYSNLQLNNGTANITILDTEVAVLGGVVLG